MDNIVDYIKSKYPKIIFKPVNFKYKRAIGFILSGNSLVVGYIDANGNLQKTHDPIDLTLLSKKNISKIIKTLPLVDGFTQDQRTNLLNLINEKNECISQQSQEKLIKQLHEQIKDKNNKDQYKILYDTEINKMAVVSKKYEKEIEKITEEWNKLKEDLKICSEQILSNDFNFNKIMEEYRKQMEGFLLDKDLQIRDLQKLSETIRKERDVLQTKFQNVLEINEKQLIELADKGDKIIELNEKYKENEELKQKISELNQRLEDLVEQYSEDKLQFRYDQKQNEPLKNKILNNKGEIIGDINKYNQKMIDWCKKSGYDINKQKQTLIKEIDVTKNKFKEILHLFKGEDNYSELRDNVNDIISEIKNAVVLQFGELNRLKNVNGELVKQNDKLQNELKDAKMLNDENQTIIEDLESERQKIINEINEIKNRNKELEEFVEKCKIESDKKTELIKELENIISELKRSNINIQDDIKEIAKKYDLDKIQLEETIATMTKKLISLEKEYHYALKQIEHYKDKEKQTKDQEQQELKQKYTDEIIKLNTAIDELTLENENKQNIINDVLKTVEKMRSIEIELQEKIKSLQSRYKIDTEELRSQILKLTQELTIEGKKLDEVTQEKKRLEINIDTLRLQLDQMQEQNSKGLNEIKYYSEEIERIKQLLQRNEKNGKTVQQTIDYNNCLELLKTFIEIHNNFTTKQKIIKSINNLIKKKNFDKTIIEQFEKTSEIIQKYINFMNLKEYTRNENYKLLLNQNQVDRDLCRNLESLHNYWLENKNEFIKQERILLDLYETLSKAVRIYIKINPLHNIEPVSRIVVSDNDLTIECGDINREYNNFTGVFNEKFTTLDIYTGIYGTINYPEIKVTNNDNNNNNDDYDINYNVTNDFNVNHENIVKNELWRGIGMYEMFEKLQNGRNINLFRYGNSKIQPYKGSLLPYILTNLENVTNIALEHLFELGMYKVDLMNKHAQGKIINLIGQLGERNSYEEPEFLEGISNNLNTNDIKVADLDRLSDYISNYRRHQGRIITTPFSDESTRTHLFSIFKITFKNGTSSKLGLVDLSEQESPKRLYNKFFKTSTSLGIALTKGYKWAESNLRLREDVHYIDYYDIFNILKTGIYLNETLNHMTFYFNKRSSMMNNNKIKIKPINIYDYDRNGFFYDPQIANEKSFERGNCLMIPILEILDPNFNSSVAIICDINQETHYCKDTIEILDFANRLL